MTCRQCSSRLQLERWNNDLRTWLCWVLLYDSRWNDDVSTLKLNFQSLWSDSGTNLCAEDEGPNKELIARFVSSINRLSECAKEPHIIWGSPKTSSQTYKTLNATSGIISPAQSTVSSYISDCSTVNVKSFFYIIIIYNYSINHLLVMSSTHSDNFPAHAYMCF